MKTKYTEYWPTHSGTPADEEEAALHQLLRKSTLRAIRAERRIKRLLNAIREARNELFFVDPRNCEIQRNPTISSRVYHLLNQTLIREESYNDDDEPT